MESTVTTWKSDESGVVIEKLAVKDGDVLVATCRGCLSSEAREYLRESIRARLAEVGLSRVAVLTADNDLTMRILNINDGDILLLTHRSPLSLDSQRDAQEAIQATLAAQGLPGVRVLVSN